MRLDSTFAGDNIFTCGRRGKSRKTLKVINGETYKFNTNIDGKQYGANVRCSGTFKMMEGCKELTISCDKFNLGPGDYLRVNRKTKNTYVNGSLITRWACVQLLFQLQRKPLATIFRGFKQNDVCLL